MRTFRKFFVVAVLTLTITVSSFAGDISFPGASSQPPPPPPQQASLGGDISFPGVKTTTEVGNPEVPVLDPTTEITLGLLESILLLF